MNRHAQIATLRALVRDTKKRIQHGKGASRAVTTNIAIDNPTAKLKPEAPPRIYLDPHAALLEFIGASHD